MTERSARKFFAYCRTNRDDLVGVAEQSSACTTLVTSLGGTVTFEVADFGTGMKALNLPGYGRMIEAIARGHVDAIVASRIDQFGKNISALNELFSLCARHDVEIWDASTGSRFATLREWMVKHQPLLAPCIRRPASSAITREWPNNLLKCVSCY